ncbi:progestin and adipoQ receptor family member 4 [Venturia canescens]|uniref:progestin and adipoQ receptor family member 4 n=1 Tax=Venturia canescens TaxID=32260 RepID=UPI001C9C5D4F|nr:progestin and adipoQ receptor family member 4 [Venturia canescens]
MTIELKRGWQRSLGLCARVRPCARTTVVTSRTKLESVALSAVLPRHAEVLLVTAEVTDLGAGFPSLRDHEHDYDDDKDETEDYDDVRVVEDPDAITTGPDEPPEAQTTNIESSKSQTRLADPTNPTNTTNSRYDRDNETRDDDQPTNAVNQTSEEKITLRNWSDMPRHLQFNPHIKTGYRPLTTFVGCILSLFYLHNETVNILTHGLAILYVLVTVPYLLPWSAQGYFTGFLSWCHLIGAVSPWIGSFLYHLFMNLNHGEAVYMRLLKLDMLGIWVCQSVGAIPMIAASVHCLPSVLWHLCIMAYCCLSLWGLFKAMRAKSPWERRLCFSPPFMMRMFFLALRCFRIGGGNPEALTHILLQDLVAVIGGSIGALRIPEKWLPGQVDIVLNSHNIMHVVVVIAVWSMHSATVQDLVWMTDPSACGAHNVSRVPRHDEL